MNIGSLDVWTPTIQELVRANLPAGFTIRFAASYDPAEQTAIVSEADVVLTGWAEVTGEMIRAAPRLRMIQKWGIGVDRIDLETARREGVVVAITAGGNADAVAEHAVMLMLAVYRRLPFVDRSVREGRWLFAEMRERCFALHGRTVGLLGFGSIGRLVARRLRGFDVHIVYFDPVRPDPAVEHELGASYRPFDELLRESDIVSLHLPGGPDNRNLIGADAFAAMKHGAVLINTARGELVDEDALCDALASGRLGGAGLDTFSSEPPSPDARLLRFDQVVLTPHTAGSVLDDVERVARHAFRNIVSVLHDGPIAEADVVVLPSQRSLPAPTRGPGDSSA